MTKGPYKLPEGWRWVRLGKVAQRESVIVKPSDQPNSTFRYLGMEHVAPGQWEEPCPVEVRGSDIRSQVIAFCPGLVLYGKLRPYLNKVVVPSREGVASTEFVPIAVRQDMVSPHYLGAFLRSPGFVAYAGRNIAGSRQPRTRLDALWGVLVPLPPLEEQRRIVARIEELMERVREAKRLRRQAKEDAERLWQSALAETFPRPGSELPPGWRWVRLGEVCRYDRRTVDPRRSPERTFYLYGIPAYDKGQRPERLDGSQIGSSKVVIGPGVCLFSKLNPRIPRAWVVAGVPQDGMPVASTEFMPLRPNPNVLDLDYLGKLLMTEWFVSQVRLDVTGATGSRQRLKPGVILNALVPLPPLAEQRRIVARLEAVQEKIRALKSAQTETDEELKHLEQAILDRAFRGEL